MSVLYILLKSHNKKKQQKALKLRKNALYLRILNLNVRLIKLVLTKN